ncbi:MAG: hypothetical protein ACI4OU_03110 [Candidatus Enterenecus sp.]
MKLPETLSHAYLITGGSGESRHEFARRLAAAYLCEGERPPCGQCRHCRKLRANAHPDLSLLSPAEGKREITVEQARALRADAYIRPNEARRKVYLIDPADSMNAAAQNALLKVLEEGPEYAAFLLLAGEPGKLLDTVRSRCEQLALPPEEAAPDPEQLEKAEALARLLLTGDELAVAEGLVALEQQKLKSGQLAELLALTERCAARDLARQPRRCARLLRALKTCRENSVYNPGPGHTLGWLAAELFQEEARE